MVLETMPDFVDRIIIVNDCSNDNTTGIVRQHMAEDKSSPFEIKDRLNHVIPDKYNRASIAAQDMLRTEAAWFIPSEVVNNDPGKERIILINQRKNSGVGAAIARGYKWCKDYGIDCTAVMAGDGQMDPGELESICKPVVEENIDYVKGNRLIHRSAWLVIPKTRYIGNSILSIFTKIASGYWHVSDTQTGYTAISNKALNAVALHKIYKSYGMPNDMLVKLNIAFCTLREVEIKPVYDIGENSKMKVSHVLPKVAMLLFLSFFKRLWIKYLFRDFHPLFFLYHFGFLLIALSLPYAYKIIRLIIKGVEAGTLPVLAFVFLFMLGLQFLLFAMWMDIQDNERLYK
jgi:glycosyltransferase involved in cell wall biosynthesis